MPYSPPSPGFPYGQPSGQPLAGAYPPQGQPPGWTPGQPYPGQYGYPARRSVGILSAPAARAAALLAAGGLLFWLFSFLPWITIAIPGRSESSSYKDVIDDLNVSNGYIVVMFLVGAMALGAAALRWPAMQRGDPVWGRMLAAAAVGAAFIVTILQFLQHSDFSDRLKANAANTNPQLAAVLEVSTGFALYLLPVACAAMAVGLWFDRPRLGNSRG